MSSLIQKCKAAWENRHFDNQWEVLASRVFGRRNGLVVYQQGDMRMLVDHQFSDQNGVKMCLVSGMYSELLDKIDLPVSPVVLDLGANAGGFSLLLRRESGSPGRLVCVEMNPNTYRRLWYNIKTNVSEVADVINAAVLGKDGDIDVNVRRGGTGESIYESMRADTQRCRIEGLSLNSLVGRFLPEGKIDLCKIDIEGAEYDVLMGDAGDALKRIQHLIIELHGGREERRKEAVVARLTEAGLEENHRFSGKEEDVRLFGRGQLEEAPEK